MSDEGSSFPLKKDLSQIQSTERGGVLEYSFWRRVRLVPMQLLVLRYRVDH